MVATCKCAIHFDYDWILIDFLCLNMHWIIYFFCAWYVIEFKRSENSCSWCTVCTHFIDFLKIKLLKTIHSEYFSVQFWKKEKKNAIDYISHYARCVLFLISKSTPMMILGDLVEWIKEYVWKNIFVNDTNARQKRFAYGH